MDRLAELREMFQQPKPQGPIHSGFKTYSEYLDIQGEQIQEALEKGQTCFLERGGPANHGKTFWGRLSNEYLTRKFGFEIVEVTLSKNVAKALQDEQVWMGIPLIRMRTYDSEGLARVASRASGYLGDEIEAILDDGQPRVVSIEAAWTTSARIDDRYEPRDGGTSTINSLARREGRFERFAGKYILNTDVFHAGELIYAVGLLLRIRREAQGAPPPALAPLRGEMHQLAERLHQMRPGIKGELIGRQYSRELRDHYEIFTYNLDEIARNNSYFNFDEFSFWRHNPRERNLVKIYGWELVTRAKNLVIDY